MRCPPQKGSRTPHSERAHTVLDSEKGKNTGCLDRKLKAGHRGDSQERDRKECAWKVEVRRKGMTVGQNSAALDHRRTSPHTTGLDQGSLARQMVRTHMGTQMTPTMEKNQEPTKTERTGTRDQLQTNTDEGTKEGAKAPHVSGGEALEDINKNKKVEVQLTALCGGKESE